MIPRGTAFKFEYLGEFKMDIKNILGNESAAHMGLIHEEKRRPKISCYCTFKRDLSNGTHFSQSPRWNVPLKSANGSCG